MEIHSWNLLSEFPLWSSVRGCFWLCTRVEAIGLMLGMNRDTPHFIEQSYTTHGKLDSENSRFLF
jgi:hypothetical protein